MPPHEVLERFSDTELVHMVAYEKRYGQLGPERFDTLFARLGMDVVAPHMKRGKRPKFEDHLIQWGQKAKEALSPQELLAKAKQIQSAFDARDKQQKKAKQQAENAKRLRDRRRRPTDGDTGRPDGEARRRRRRR